MYICLYMYDENNSCVQLNAIQAGVLQPTFLNILGLLNLVLPTPRTLHPAPCTLNLAPCPLHPTP